MSFYYGISNFNLLFKLFSKFSVLLVFHFDFVIFISGEFQLATILGNAVQRVDMRCKTCGALGHGSRECPESGERDYKMARVTCKICGDQGHTAMDCPQKERTVSYIYKTKPISKT